MVIELKDECGTWIDEPKIIAENSFLTTKKDSDMLIIPIEPYLH